MTDREDLPAFVRTAFQLKGLPRTGWLDRGIPAEETESVADHSFGVALLAWLLAPKELDRSRVVELALIHDLAEAITGDATPYDRAALQTLDPDTRRNWLAQRHVRSEAQLAEKRESENAAIEQLAAWLPDDRRDLLRTRWAELQERSTAESRFVKEMDILETWLQSREYARRHLDASMESFELEAREVLGGSFVDWSKMGM